MHVNTAWQDELTILGRLVSPSKQTSSCSADDDVLLTQNRAPFNILNAPFERGCRGDEDVCINLRKKSVCVNLGRSEGRTVPFRLLHFSLCLALQAVLILLTGRRYIMSVRKYILVEFLRPSFKGECRVRSIKLRDE